MEEFLTKINDIKITGHISNNSVNFEFSWEAQPEPEEEIDEDALLADDNDQLRK